MNLGHRYLLTTVSLNAWLNVVMIIYTTSARVSDIPLKVT